MKNSNKAYKNFKRPITIGIQQRIITQVIILFRSFFVIFISFTCNYGDKDT